ncbi:formyl peptide receptor 2-like [Leptodactylus fuscus]|uniref:formyl peptide receptor 2-like n=1 Tax=Leptodactylus fuscus TaxID=238119 RepID=UPI003F4F1E30
MLLGIDIRSSAFTDEWKGPGEEQRKGKKVKMNPVDYYPTLPGTTPDYNDLSDLYYGNILQKVSITFYSIISVLGIIGNGLVIWIAGFRMKKTISAVWFLNLAIADFLCCASLPLLIAEDLDILRNLPVNPFCISDIILSTINMSASVLLLTAMSIDRCVSVMWPFWAKVYRTRRLVRITAGGIWLLSLPFTGLLLYINGWCKTNLHYNDIVYFEKIGQVISPFMFFMLFVIPFLIILTSYLIIFLKLRKSNRPQRSQRPYRIITAVILCFFICWFPYYIWPLIPLYDVAGNNVFSTINIIVNSLAVLNSCINPIIYVFMVQDFRQGFLRSIPARLKRALSDSPDDLSREPEDCELQNNTIYSM